MYIYRESVQQEINFICKSFRQRLHQLHIYNEMLLLHMSNMHQNLLQEPVNAIMHRFISRKPIIMGETLLLLCSF